MELAGKLLHGAILDAFVFCAELIALLFVSTRRHVGFERYFLLFYGLTVLTAYNIYIKFIHDFNIPIARTFLYKFNVFGPFYLFDIFLFSAIFVLFIKYLLRPSGFGTSLGNQVGAVVYGRDLIIFLVSCVGFYLYVDMGYPGSVVSQMRPIRGLLLGTVAIWAFSRLSAGVENENHARRLVVTLAIIDLVNVVGELVSARIFADYVWQRGGHDVILLNQANSVAAVTYIPLLFLWRRFGYKVSLFGLIYLCLLLYDYTKGLYLLIPLIIIFYGIVSMYHGLINIKYAATICVVVLIGIFVLPGILSDKAISGTRSIQLVSYWKAIERVPTALAFGSGFGGMYSVIAETDDGGEIKEVDREESRTHQVQFQVPIFYFLKTSGLIGMSLAIAVVFVLFFWALKTRPFDPVLSVYFILMMITSLLAPPFLSGEPHSIIQTSRCLFMISLLSRRFIPQRSTA